MSCLKRFLLILLTLATLMTVLASCSEGDPQETDTESNSTESSKESGSGDVVGTPSILDGVTFPGKVLNVLVENRGNVVEYVEKVDAKTDVLDKALYDRVDRAETRLQLRTRWELINSADEYREKAELENQNGGEWDVMDSRSESAPLLMTRGVFSNLMAQKYFDFAHAGWSQSLVEDCSVNNKLYFATGDVSPNLVFMTNVVYFNKALVEDFGINGKIQEHADWEASNLYELVEKGKWTLDKLITLSENVYKDGGISGTSNGKKDSGDLFGFTTYHNMFPNFYWGGGYMCVEIMDDGFKISDDYLNVDLVGNILTTVIDFMYNSQYGFVESGYAKSKENFAAGNVLFTMGPASHAWNTYSKEQKLEYSVLPIPKHTETQERYCATQSTNYLLVSIASKSKNADAACAFLQALTEASYELTRPAIIDTLMKGRYAEDPIDAKMWDYAIEANGFDLGRVYGYLFTEPGVELPLPEKLIRERIQAESDNWGYVVDGYSEALAIMASNLAGEIAGLVD